MIFCIARSAMVGRGVFAASESIDRRSDAEDCACGTMSCGKCDAHAGAQARKLAARTDASLEPVVNGLLAASARPFPACAALVRDCVAAGLLVGPRRCSRSVVCSPVTRLCCKCLW